MSHNRADLKAALDAATVTAWKDLLDTKARAAAARQRRARAARAARAAREACKAAREAWLVALENRAALAPAAGDLR